MGHSLKYLSRVRTQSWIDLWIYFVSPVLAMLLAAEVFRSSKRMWRHRAKRTQLPHYPLAATAGATTQVQRGKLLSAPTIGAA